MEQAIVKGYNDASRLFMENKLDAALAICLTLLKKVPSNSTVLNLAGSTLYKKKLFTEAENLLIAANQLSPGVEEITLNLARVLRKTNQTQRALETLEQGLIYTPESKRILSTLGETLYYDNQFEAAAQAFEKILTATPGDTELLFRLACCYQECDKTQAAFSIYERILKLAPAHADAHVNLARIYNSLGNYESSKKLFQRSAELVPDSPEYSSRSLFSMNYSFVGGEDFLEEAIQWAQRHADPLFPASPPVIEREKTSRISLGFISADYSMHPVGNIFLPVLKHLDRDQFDIHCFSNVQIEDAMTEEFKRYAPNYYRIRDLDDITVSKMIRSIGIDVLVDLSGHSNGNRLGVMARKPAPIQITWLGYFNTTGMQAMDYIIGDWVNIPEGDERYYKENVLRLQDSFFPYALPDFKPTPMKPKSEYITFGCFNDSAKINDRVLKCWSEILDKVQNSRLILKSRTFSDLWVRDLFIERSIQQGISPHKLIFLGPTSYQHYLESYAQVDIALDPFPYSGGATTADALLTGTPVLTCPFDSFGSRLSASILHACDMDWLICNDLDDYIAKAVQLGTDDRLREELTHSLIQSFPQSRFCNVKRFTRNFEKILLSTRAHRC